MAGRTVLQDLALVFCVASVVTILFQRLRQPVVLGYLLAGLIVGPFVPIPLFADVDHIEMLAELGVILVIFSIGLEFRLEKLVSVLPTAGIVGAVQVPAMLWIGYLIGQVAGWSGVESLFLGGVMCISSTMIVARVLAERDPDARVSEAIFGVLVVQDLAAIVLIAVFTAVSSGVDLPPSEVAIMVGELLMFLVATAAVGLLLVPRLVREAHHRGNSEVLLMAAIGVCFGAALLAEHLGYSVALGAFLGGLLIAESGRRRQVEHLVEPIRDLFAAVFAVSIGMLVDPHALLDNWAMVLIVSGAILIGQPLFIGFGMLLSGRDLGISVRAGMSLAQIGEFSFIIVGIGVAGGVLPPRMMAIAVGVAMVTSFLTPVMMRVSSRVATMVEGRLPRPVQTFFSLYSSWLESLRNRKRPALGMRRYVLWLVIDVVVLAMLVVGLAVGRDAGAAELSRRTGLPVRISALIEMGAVFLLCMPFVLGLARNVRLLAGSLATSLLPATEGVDLADAPRRALVVGLQLGVTLVAVVPLVALTQPFLPIYAGALVLAILAGGLGWMFWRRASNLHGHVRAGAELMVEALNRQRAADDEPELGDDARALLPGLGPLLAIQVAPESDAVGRSLAELNLRARTGASVLAIRRPGGADIATPAGADRIHLGDILVVTGSSDSVELARAILRGDLGATDPVDGHPRAAADD